MSRTFYTDYVRHALRFYSRNCDTQPLFKTQADKENWLSCHNILKSLTPKDKGLLISVYSGHDTLADEVYNTSKKFNVDQNIIWDLMKDIERKIARKRGLM
jgi:hypothetical protein